MAFCVLDTSAENFAQAIINWWAVLDVSKGLTSDGTTQFRNEILQLVTKGFRVPHHFTLSYTPLSYGTVERLRKELLLIFREATSELQLCHEEWPDLLPLLQSTINNARSPQRSNLGRITSMIGVDPSTPIFIFYRSKTCKAVNISDFIHKRTSKVRSTLQTVCKLYPVVQDAVRENWGPIH